MEDLDKDIIPLMHFNTMVENYIILLNCSINIVQRIGTNSLNFLLFTLIYVDISRYIIPEVASLNLQNFYIIVKQ